MDARGSLINMEITGGLTIGSVAMSAHIKKHSAPAATLSVSLCLGRTVNDCHDAVVTLHCTILALTKLPSTYSGGILPWHQLCNGKEDDH